MSRVFSNSWTNSFGMTKSMANGVLGLHGDTAVKHVAMGQKREHEVVDVHPRKELDHLALALLFKILLVWKPLVHVIKA